VFALYVLLWGWFAIGSLVLAAQMTVSTIRILGGWRPQPSRRAATQAALGLTGASSFGLAYGAFVWFGFPSEDASRGISAFPPLVFGALAMTFAGGVAITARVTRGSAVTGRNPGGSDD
jgi:hypothetical protein